MPVVAHSSPDAGRIADRRAELRTSERTAHQETSSTRPVQAAKPAISTGPLDAQVSIGSLMVAGPLPRSDIQQAVSRHVSRFRACYRSASVTANRNAAGTVDVSIYIDSSNTVQKAKATGDPLPGIAACVQKVATATRPRAAPDVGGVHIKFQVKFKPLKK
jgi:hypothetical protein